MWINEPSNNVKGPPPSLELWATSPYFRNHSAVRSMTSWHVWKQKSRLEWKVTVKFTVLKKFFVTHPSQEYTLLGVVCEMPQRLRCWKDWFPAGGLLRKQRDFLEVGLAGWTSRVGDLNIITWPCLLLLPSFLPSCLSFALSGPLPPPIPSLLILGKVLTVPLAPISTERAPATIKLWPNFS